MTKIDKIFELNATKQKSYNGKAQILIDTDGRIFLKSYDTIVGGFEKCGRFVRYWNSYSRTTQKHINDFLKLYHMPVISKSGWEALPVEACPICM